MKTIPILCKRAVCSLLALLLLSSLLSACGGAEPSSRPVIEENRGDNKTAYPRVVHTSSATWYFAADDIALLGEDAFYESFYALLELQEQDFADARAALKGYIPDEIPAIDIYTAFSSKDEITELTDAYYDQRNNYIKLYFGWENAGTALLHEYVHYLTQHCTEKPASFGFYAEGIAEYISKLVCKNRMARRVNLAASEEELANLKAHGAWDETENCIDLVKTYYGQAEFYAQGGGVGSNIYTVVNTTDPRTEDMWKYPTAETVSHMEAACMMAYLIETYSLDTVMKSLPTDPKFFPTVYGESFTDLYWKWAAWNTEKCAELGID